jgi:hypothetical protein
VVAAITIPTVHDVVFAVVVLAIVGIVWSIVRPSIAEPIQRPIFVVIVSVLAVWLAWFFGLIQALG